MDPSDDDVKTGRWTFQEHQKFMEAYGLFGKDWKKVANFIGTRNNIQCRTHAQKIFRSVPPPVIAAKPVISKEIIQEKVTENQDVLLQESDPKKETKPASVSLGDVIQILKQTTVPTNNIKSQIQRKLSNQSMKKGLKKVSSSQHLKKIPPSINNVMKAPVSLPLFPSITQQYHPPRYFQGEFNNMLNTPLLNRLVPPPSQLFLMNQNPPSSIFSPLPFPTFARLPESKEQ